jgi:hypothetical protein
LQFEITMTQIASPIPITQPTSDSSVESRLRAAWRKQRRFVHLRGLCFILLWIVCLLAVDFLIDWLFGLPHFGRVSLVVINIGILLYVGYTHWWRDLRAYNPRDVALQVERRHPELKSLLVSYIQLAENQPEGSQASPALIRAMKGQAITATRPINFKEIISYNELQRILLTSVAMVIFAVLISARWSDYFRVLMARLLTGAQLAYPTRTHIDDPSDLIVRQGDPINLEIHVRGMAPSEGSLYVTPFHLNDKNEVQKEETERLPIALQSPSTQPTAPLPYRIYPFVFDSAFKDFYFYAKVGDAQSVARKVVVIPPPVISASKVLIKHKAYMNRPDKTSELLNIEAPEGSNLSWEIVTDKPVNSAVLLLGDKDDALKSIPMVLEKDGKTMRATLPATQSMPYRFEWKEKDHGFTFREDTRHYIQVTPDTPPDVEILKPTTDDKATVQKTLTIVFRGADDYGITKARIIYSFNDGPEKTKEIADFKGGLGQVKWVLKPDLPEFKDGDLLVMNYSIEVEDNFDGQGGAHKARSSSRTLAIVSIPEYQQYMYEKYGKVIDEIKEAHTAEQKSQTEVKTLKTLPTTQP